MSVTRTHPTFNGRKMKVIQVVVKVKTGEILSECDISSRFAEQELTDDDINYEREFKALVLSGKKGNVYYELSYL